MSKTQIPSSNVIIIDTNNYYHHQHLQPNIVKEILAIMCNLMYYHFLDPLVGSFY